MGKKRKLRKLMRRRLVEEAPAVVICVGKSCASREQSRALVELARARAAAGASLVRVEMVGCLHVCEDGPVVATYPKIKFHRRVDGEGVQALVDRLGRGGEDASPETPVATRTHSLDGDPTSG